MRHRSRLAAVLAAAALLSGAVACTDGDDSTPVDTQELSADAIVLMKPGSTDLNALDLRDKLIPLSGVESVVYDQAVKRLRINFTAAATPADRSAAVAVAQQDPSVERVREAGQGDAVSQAPAPS